MIFATLFLGLLPAFFKNLPGIGDKAQQIIADVTGVVQAIFGSGVLTQPSVNAALMAWQGVIEMLQNDPSLPPATLTALLQLEKMVQAGITQDAIAAKAVDWTQINPITPVA